MSLYYSIALYYNFVFSLRRRNVGNRSNMGELDDVRDDDENATWNGNSTQQK